MLRLAKQGCDQNESAEYRYPHCTAPSRLLKKRPLNGSFPCDQQFSGNNFKSIFGRIEIEMLQYPGRLTSPMPARRAPLPSFRQGNLAGGRRIEVGGRAALEAA